MDPADVEKDAIDECGVTGEADATTDARELAEIHAGLMEIMADVEAASAVADSRAGDAIEIKCLPAAPPRKFTPTLREVNVDGMKIILASVEPGKYTIIIPTAYASQSLCRFDVPPGFDPEKYFTLALFVARKAAKPQDILAALQFRKI